MKVGFVQLAGFVTEWRKQRLTDDDLRGLELDLLNNVVAGRPMGGTGGLRKIRFASVTRNVGKSGAFRVCYLYLPIAGLVYFVEIYGKNDKANLSPAQRQEVKKLIARIKLMHHEE